MRLISHFLYGANDGHSSLGMSLLFTTCRHGISLLHVDKVYVCPIHLAKKDRGAIEFSKLL